MNSRALYVIAKTIWYLVHGFLFASGLAILGLIVWVLFVDETARWLLLMTLGYFLIVGLGTLWGWTTKTIKQYELRNKK